MKSRASQPLARRWGSVGRRCKRYSFQPQPYIYIWGGKRKAAELSISRSEKEKKGEWDKAERQVWFALGSFIAPVWSVGIDNPFRGVFSVFRGKDTRGVIDCILSYFLPQNISSKENSRVAPPPSPPLSLSLLARSERLRATSELSEVRRCDSLAREVGGGEGEREGEASLPCLQPLLTWTVEDTPAPIPALAPVSTAPKRS